MIFYNLIDRIDQPCKYSLNYAIKITNFYEHLRNRRPAKTDHIFYHT